MLKYVKDQLPGIPARDLTDAEVEKYGGKSLLIGSGVYMEEKIQSSTPENKMEKRSIMNKEDVNG